MAESILKTVLEIDKSDYESDLQREYVEPSARAGQKAAQNLTNAGTASLSRLRQFGKETAEVLANANNPKTAQSFADNYKRAFDDVTKRAENTRAVFARISQQKFDGKNFDALGQGASVAERRVSELIVRIQRLKSDAGKAIFAPDFKNYVEDIRKAEAELAKFESKARTLNNRSGGAGNGGNGDFSNAFAGRVGLSGTGSALLGGFAGAATFTALNGIKNLFGDILSQAQDLTLASVKLAGNFEETTNALAVFAGGTGAARRELDLLDQAALATPGLKLEAAEEGYQKLRALNFEAKLSRDLIQGLGTQRVLSGADATSVTRVITNLIQLSSGAGSSRDVKESVLALPSLRPVFQQSFGTTDFKKIAELIKENPDVALGKFAESLARAQKAQIGLNVTLEKGADAVIVAGRAFGEPFLAPFTEDATTLTKVLSDNTQEIRAFGQAFADVYSQVSRLGKTLATGGGVVGDVARGTILGTGRGILAAGTLGVSEFVVGGFNAAAAAGASNRGIAERSRAYATKESLGVNDFGRRKDATGFGAAIFNPDGTLSYDGDKAAVSKQREDSEEDEKRQLKVRQQLLDSTKQLNLQEISSRTEYQKALTALRAPTRSNLETIKENTQIELEGLRARRAVQNEATEKSVGNLSSEQLKDGEDLKLRQQNSIELARIDSEIAVSRINAQRQINEEIKRGRDELKSFFFAAQSENPFAKVFSDIAGLADKIRTIPKEFQALAEQIEKTRLANELSKIRYSVGSGALRSEQEARRLALTPDTETNGFQGRLQATQQEAAIRAGLANAEREARNAGYYASGYNPNNPKSADEFFSRRGFGQANNEFVNKSGNLLEDIAAIQKTNLRDTGVYGRGAVAGQILNLVKDSDVPDLLKQSSGFGQGAENARRLLTERANATSAQRDLKRQEFDDFLQKQQFVALGRKEAEERLSELKNAKGLTDRQKNQEFLNLTSEIGVENLNPALKKGRINALNADATFKREQEKELLNKVINISDAFDKVVGANGIKAVFGETPFLNVGLTVEGKPANVTQTKADRPNPADTANGMNLPSVVSGGGLTNR